MKTTLDRALDCGEIKSKEVEELRCEIDKLKEEQTSYSCQVSDLNKEKEKLESELQIASDRLTSFKDDYQKLVSDHVENVNKMKEQHKTEVDQYKNQNKKIESDSSKAHKVGQAHVIKLYDSFFLAIVYVILILFLIRSSSLKNNSLISKDRFYDPVKLDTSA